MQRSFSFAGAQGQVDVVVAVNANPQTLGCRPAAKGFPYCTASVTHPARGYAAAMGWIQLVGSTDDASRGTSFEMDPFEPLGPVSYPFAFFGFLPTLFDAPSRETISNMDWTAHSFLCRLAEHRHQTSAILGFSWGFTIDDGTITLRGPEALGSQDWDAHRSTLEREHPGWSFSPGFKDT
jgi:hypothetical protein